MPIHRLPARLLLVMLAITATSAPARSASPRDGNVWTPLEARPGRDGPTRSQTLTVDLERLRGLLAGAPPESRGWKAGVEITLPMPDGRLVRFRAVEAAMLGPAMRASHPEVRTYVAGGVDRAPLSAHLDLTALGVRAIVFAPEGVALIDPLVQGRTDRVVSRWASDEEVPRFDCETLEIPGAAAIPARPEIHALGDQLRTLRVIMMATGEYTQALGGVAAATATLITQLNRVSAVFERDAALRLELVQAWAFPDPATDPYVWTNYVELIDQNTAVVDGMFGASGYDVSQVLTRIPGTATRGVSFVPALCFDGYKGGSVVASIAPGTFGEQLTMGHELGHAAAGGTHTQDRGCNRSPESAWEVGSGITILCSMPAACPVDFQPVRDPYYHAGTIEQFSATLAAYPDCGTQAPTGNTPPSADAGPDCTIPTGTPFVLSGIGADADPGDTLTYTWEQLDIGPAPFDPIYGPLFRWRLPTRTPERWFPALSTVLSGVVDPYEKLATADRLLHFRLLVRDNHPGTGGVAWDDRVVIVSGAPFAVTYPNGGNTIVSGQPFTVTWSVGGGSVAATVDVLLSTDGGTSWIPLATGTANDGSETVTYTAGAASASCRVMVRSVGNIFYDVSDADFAIDVNTPTLVAELQAESAAGGIVIRWRLSDPTRVLRTVVERSVEEAGPWSVPEGESIEDSGESRFLDQSVEPGRSYHYRLRVSTDQGVITFGPIAASALAMPGGASITRTSPNPCRGPLWIEYLVPRSARLSLTVLDLQGRVVATLRDGLESPGVHQAKWEGNDALGRKSGVFFVRLVYPGGHAMRRVVVTR